MEKLQQFEKSLGFATWQRRAFRRLVRILFPVSIAAMFYFGTCAVMELNSGDRQIFITFVVSAALSAVVTYILYRIQ